MQIEITSGYPAAMNCLAALKEAKLIDPEWFSFGQGAIVVHPLNEDPETLTAIRKIAAQFGGMETNGPTLLESAATQRWHLG